MSRQVFKYLIPIYLVWFFTHMILFFRFILLHAGSTVEPMLSGDFALLMLSHFLVIILGAAFVIYMLVDCSMRKFNEDSQKVIWVLVIIFFSIIGAIVYYYLYGQNPRE